MTVIDINPDGTVEIDPFVQSEKSPTAPVSHGDAAGAEILDRLRAAFVRYVAFPSAEAADAVTLWTAATHAQPAWDHAPRFVVTSPEPECGKSRVMDVATETCHSPLITTNSTAPATFRSITEDPPTLLMDEADAVFGTRKQAENNEDLRALINAGHQRNRPCRRCVGPSHTPTDFQTFAMVMLAAIGNLPDTILTRAIVIRMRRRAPGESVAPFRTSRDIPPLNALRDELATWIRPNIDTLRGVVPTMPLEDRAADTWEPLIAVADLAGGGWSERARRAAVVLTQEAAADATESSLGLTLLSDLRTVFGDAVALYTTTLLERLQALEEAPWADVFGKPLDSRGLARRLKPYGVKSKDVREGGTGDQRKGYRREDLYPAWERYLPTGREDATSATTATAEVSPTPIRPGVAEMTATPGPAATLLTSDVADVALVAPMPSVAVPVLPAQPHNTSPNGFAGQGSGCTVAAVSEGIGASSWNADADHVDQHDAAIALLTKGLGAEVVGPAPKGGELFVFAADLDFPRTDLPDGTTILGTEDCWRVFCKAALSHDRAAAFRALKGLESHAT